MVRDWRSAGFSGGEGGGILQSGGGGFFDGLWVSIEEKSQTIGLSTIAGTPVRSGYAGRFVFSPPTRLWNVLGEMRVCKGVIAKSRTRDFVVRTRMTLADSQLDHTIGKRGGGNNPSGMYSFLAQSERGCGGGSPCSANLFSLQSSPKATITLSRLPFRDGAAGLGKCGSFWAILFGLFGI
jgi:hypothetical protein